MSEFVSGNNHFYYEVHGNGEPLLLIAGFTCDSTLWGDLVTAFKNLYQVIIFDNRGVGRSSIPKEPYAIEEMAGDVVSLIHHLNVKSAHVLGHSMGGAIAQTIAYKYPEVVKKLILSNSSAKFRKCALHAQEFVYTLKINNIPLELQAESVVPWLYSDHFLENPEIGKGFIQAALDNPYPQTLEGFQGQLYALVNFDSRKWLLDVNMPTLIVAGGEDRICLKDFEELQLLLPQSQTLFFPNAGHHSFAEEPEKFVRGVMDFLNEQPAEVIPSL